MHWDERKYALPQAAASCASSSATRATKPKFASTLRTVKIDRGAQRSLVLNFMAGKRGHGPVQSLKLHHGPTELEDVMSGQLSNGMNFGQVQRACKNDSSKRRQFNIFQYINIYQ
ncbi:hypothetical protein M514_10165 [Trichuris suis]|uniref:Uncharacterized protein n=1 Tax=Trichuris suis TaxID=68888 RepID=A0A085NG88_9BILA|nr:hypothetical protein M514_10165 [Trichuris suis]